MTAAKQSSTGLRVGYVVKRYPRFSETFVVNEILAHERAGRQVEIISLYPPNDTHFQNLISQVRAPVTYLLAEGLRGGDFWKALVNAARVCPGVWSQLERGGRSEGREVYQAALLAKLCVERGLGHLHAHFASTAAGVARLAAGMSGITYSLTAHAKDIFHEEVVAEELRMKLGDAARVITVSDYNVEFLKREHAGASNRVVRVYNGLDLGRFPFTPLSGRRAKIVAVGRLIEKKGFGTLLEAASLLVTRGHRFEVVVIGCGEMEAELKRQAERLGLGGVVEFAGALPQPEVVRHVSEAVAFAAPCVVGKDGNADGLPTVLLEAMALGTPCVGTDVTGIPEVIHHGRTGLMVGQRDVVGLAGALERLLLDLKFGADLARAARGLMEREFDAYRNAAEIWWWFEQAAASVGARGMNRMSASERVVEKGLNLALPAQGNGGWS